MTPPNSISKFDCFKLGLTLNNDYYAACTLTTGTPTVNGTPTKIGILIRATLQGQIEIRTPLRTCSEMLKREMEDLFRKDEV